ncbi:site-specific recombinase, phage integrase family [delta proteobacterium NaphS2]|nr:site-specific recombinase, phage integrase family [delta proteobacterium NaphS2]
MGNIKWSRLGKGLEYFNHETRKHGVKFDRYLRGRFKVAGKTTTVSFGWESEWSVGERARIKKSGNKSSRLSFVDYCRGELSRLKANAKKGTGPTTIKEERAIAEILKKKEEQAKAAKANESISFGEYFKETYYPIAQTSKKKRSYEQELSHFNNWLNPVIGNMRLKDIRPMHLERVKQNLLSAQAMSRNREPKKGPVKKQARSPRMIQYVFATGRQCWNYARRDGLVSNEWPGKDVKLPKVENQRMRFLTDEEGDQLLAGLKERSQQLHDICLLSLDSGLRAYEIFSLSWNRVDLDQKLVKVFDSKGKDRVVYLTDRTVNMLRGLPRDNGLVFKSRTGEQIKEISNSFHREVDSLGWNDGVKSHKDRLVFHSLRHSYASRLVARGVDLYVVGQLMGHSDLTMTKRYSHLRPDTLQAAVRTLETSTAAKSQDKVIELKANEE